MQRWKHAGRGPKCALLVGLLLGVASLVLYQSAYAATLQQPGYPGSIALPGTSNGPPLGCTPTGTSNQTWACGFNANSQVSFTVNGVAAGKASVQSTGCILVILTFSPGEVSVNFNTPVATHVGWNAIVVQGHKTTNGATATIGVRFRFQVPHGNSQSCVVTPVGPTTPTTKPTGTTGTTGSTPTTLHRPGFPLFTTSTRYLPTTLAKAIESPLQISPNKVILETSLLAAVLAAVLSAGALGSLWAAGARDVPAAAAAGAAAGGDDAGDGDTPPPAPPPPAPPSAPSAPSAPGGGAGAGAPTVTRGTNAFSRPRPTTPSGGGGQ